MNINATAIILARAGSKGLPRKNIAPVGGKPCIQWTIDAARDATHVDQIIVSTDDPDIQSLATQLGCLVVNRPPELATDNATIDDAARHAFNHATNPEAPVVILYANVPVRPTTLIDDALERLAQTNADSVQSFAKVGKHHPWWTVTLDDNSTVQPWQGDVLYHNCFRRQDLPPASVPDGGVIALTPQALTLQTNAPKGPHQFLGLDRKGIQTHEGDVIDIDTKIDQLVADAILSDDPTTEHTEPNS